MTDVVSDCRITLDCICNVVKKDIVNMFLAPEIVVNGYFLPQAKPMCISYLYRGLWDF